MIVACVSHRKPRHMHAAILLTIKIVKLKTLQFVSVACKMTV